ncbi:hypothetical protein D3C86_1676180 [compost metagenome]
MALQEGAETDQGDAVLLVQRSGDLFEHRVEHAVGLLLAEVGFFRDDGGEFRFTHTCLLSLFLLSRCSLADELPARRSRARTVRKRGKPAGQALACG